MLKIEIDLDRITVRNLQFIAKWKCRTVDQQATYILKQYIETYERKRLERGRLRRMQEQADAANANLT